jgi:hypothetical protein
MKNNHKSTDGAETGFSGNALFNILNRACDNAYELYRHASAASLLQEGVPLDDIKRYANSCSTGRNWLGHPGQYARQRKDVVKALRSRAKGRAFTTV